MSVARNRSAARHKLEQQVNAEALSFVDGFQPLSPRSCEAAMARPKTTKNLAKHLRSALLNWWQKLKKGQEQLKQALNLATTNDNE